jgi:hypothetical protein
MLLKQPVNAPAQSFGQAKQAEDSGDAPDDLDFRMALHRNIMRGTEFSTPEPKTISTTSTKRKHTLSITLT